jgi:hypothetical protein
VFSADKNTNLNKKLSTYHINKLEQEKIENSVEQPKEKIENFV